MDNERKDIEKEVEEKETIVRGKGGWKDWRDRGRRVTEIHIHTER